MNVLKSKITSALDFVRAERIYFLILLLTLVFLVLRSNQLSLPESISSQAVDQLEKASRSWGKSVDGLSAWIQIFHSRPVAVLACAAIMVFFTGLFLGGIIILILTAMIPRLSQWFRDFALHPSEREWKPVLFFRVLILIFSFIMASSGLIEHFWGSHSRNENLIGLLHTLLIDFLASLSAFAVLKPQGMTWSCLIGKPSASHGNEVKRGLAAYTAAFPIFISSLFLVLGISEWLNYEPPLHPLIKIFVEEESRSPFVFQFALILATIGAPIFEEIFFRGFCYRLFRSWWGVPGAMGMSAAFFAGIHGSGFAFFPIFILGLALAWLYEKRGSLTACWTFHILHNCLFTGYFFAMKALLAL